MLSVLRLTEPVISLQTSSFSILVDVVLRSIGGLLSDYVPVSPFVRRLPNLLLSRRRRLNWALGPCTVVTRTCLTMLTCFLTR